MKDSKLLAEYIMNSTLYSELYSIGEKFYVMDAVSIFKYPHYPLWSPDTDWNQLMLVVEKIENEQQGWVTVKIYDDHCSIEAGTSVLVSVNWNIKSKHKAVYNACVEYIKNK